MKFPIGDYVGKRVFFVGIGGSSMSGLARMLKWMGYDVAGSDQTRSHKVEALEKDGIEVYVGHNGDNVKGSDLVVYSAAISLKNPERKYALDNNIPQIE